MMGLLHHRHSMWRGHPTADEDQASGDDAHYRDGGTWLVTIGINPRTRGTGSVTRRIELVTEGMCALLHGMVLVKDGIGLLRVR
jgi:hypothetical protein